MVQTTFTFYGHANIVSEARAICEVEGGPTYEITLKGEASLIDYEFDFVEIDYNKIVSKYVFIVCFLDDVFFDSRYIFILDWFEFVLYIKIFIQDHRRK